MRARGHDFVAENDALRDELDALRDENHTLRDELDAVRDENHALRDELDAVREESRVLAGKVTELEARLGQSSSNSSLPPSSDSLKSRAQRRAEQREAAKNKRSENTRARGKQPGQEGKYLEMRDDPDHVVVHDPERCDACGKDLGNAEVEAVERRQVLDTPDPTIICIEHQSVKKRCSCGVLTAGPFPPEARAPVSYGPNVRASALYLVDEQHLSVERTQDAVSSMLGVSVSSGFISSLVEEAARELEKAGFVDVLKERLLDEAVLHADETPDQVGTKTWYFHVATSKLYTYLFASTTRAKSAPDEAGVLGSFRGVMVHDRLKMYFHSDYQKAKHAICLAHITRELEGVAAVFSQEPWARGMKELLLETNDACHAAREAGRTRLGRRRLEDFMARYDALVEQGLAANPEPVGRPRDYLERKSYNLAKALGDLRSEATFFARDLRVPFSNNDAERPLRMVKLHKKISGCFQSGDHARYFATIRSYTGTARKHGIGALEVLGRLFRGDVWMPPLVT